MERDDKVIAPSFKAQYLTLERLPCWDDVWHLQAMPSFPD
jgi:hypothetical protein